MRKRILYLIHTTQMHGASISFFNMVKGLKLRTDYDLFVFVPINQKKINKSYISELKAIGCNIIYGFVGVSRIDKKFSLKSLVFFLLNLIFKFISFIEMSFIVLWIKPSIIHTNVGIIHEGFLVSKLFRIPHIWHLREYQDLDFDWNIFPFKSFFCKELDKSIVIAISEGIAEHFLLRNNFSVIYNPIFENIPESLMNKKENYFLVSNRISEEKGIEDILEAFSLFKKRDEKYILKIAGTGKDDYIIYLKERCKELGIDTAVEFLGHINEINVMQRSAVALIVGSYFEGFGRMSAEAILNNTLVIGRNSGGTKEIITKTQGGFLFSNVEEMANSMFDVVHLIDDKEYENYITSANLRARQLFDYDESINKIINIYEGIKC